MVVNFSSIKICPKVKSAKHLFNVFGNSNVYITRGYRVGRSHYQPKELSWQWRVKDNPEIYQCSLAKQLCPDKKPCPKTTFFPKFRRSKEKEKYKWYEYLKFLLPDPKPKGPSIGMCKKLLQYRQDKCLDPQDWECCKVVCFKEPKEWYGQGTVYAVIPKTDRLKTPISLLKSCAPPDHMIPRCVLAKKNKKPIERKTICSIDKAYQAPYSDIKGVSLKKKTNKYVCRVKCFHDYPKISDKTIKLTCRWFADLKDVECPKQLFNRFKNIEITSKGEIRPKSVKKDVPGAKIEVKKGVCERQTLLRPPGIRNYSTFSHNFSGSKKLTNINNVGISVNGKFLTDIQRLLKKKCNKNESTILNVRNFSKKPTKQSKSKKDKGKEKKSGSKKKDTNSKKKEKSKKKHKAKGKSEHEEEKMEPICGGCSGIRQALDPKPKLKVGYKAKCSLRAGGSKCKVDEKDRGPDAPPIVSPYWKCKTANLSICNKPRPQKIKKEWPPLPCQPKKKKFHTAAT